LASPAVSSFLGELLAQLELELGGLESGRGLEEVLIITRLGHFRRGLGSASQLTGHHTNTCQKDRSPKLNKSVPISTGLALLFLNYMHQIKCIANSDSKAHWMTFSFAKKYFSTSGSRSLSLNLCDPTCQA